MYYVALLMEVADMESDSPQTSSGQPGNTARRELLEKFGRFAALTPTAMILLPGESHAGGGGWHKGKRKKRHRDKDSEYH